MDHQYVDRKNGSLVDEGLLGHRLLKLILPEHSEDRGTLYRVLTGNRWPTKALAWLNYDFALSGAFPWTRQFIERQPEAAGECLFWPPRTLRGFFERQIRYWECRPMPSDPFTVVSPSDCRILVGSLVETSQLFLKEKFFSLEELLGKPEWISRFEGGDFAVCRLTPEKYHYNHVPVSGEVADEYSIDGAFNSCHPSVQVALATAISKNQRAVTIIDTDVLGGSQIGRVAMIEVVALMIGRIESRYSPERYDNPRPIHTGMFLERGAPKSLFRPGSSTVVLLFEQGKIAFSTDIVQNMSRPGRSIFTAGFARPLLETDVLVRQEIAQGRLFE